MQLYRIFFVHRTLQGQPALMKRIHFPYPCVVFLSLLSFCRRRLRDRRRCGMAKFEADRPSATTFTPETAK